MTSRPSTLKSTLQLQSKPGQARHPGGTISIALAALVIMGFCTILGPRFVDATAQWIVVIVPVVLGLLAGQRLYRSVISGDGLQSMATLIMSLIILVGVAIPGYQLAHHERDSVLSLLHVTAFDPAAGIPKAYYLFTICLCALAISESYGFASTTRRFRKVRAETPEIFICLLVMGCVGIALLHVGGHSQAVLQARGQTRGQGFAAVLADCIPSGIALGILQSHWGKRSYVAFGVLSFTFFAITADSRSPLVFIAVAVVLRFTAFARARGGLKLGAVIGIGLMVYLTSLFVVSFDQYRGSIVRGQPQSLVSSTAQALPNPVIRLASKGNLDTLDGSILAIHTDRAAVHATWLDPLKAVSGLVPYQLWHSKPRFLGQVVTDHYSDFGGLSGIFLSGPGYVYIVFGGMLGAFFAFALLGVISGRLFRVLRDRPFWACYLMYFLVRFVSGGDAFDGLYVFTQVVGVLFARGAMALIVRGKSQKLRRVSRRARVSPSH